MKYFEYGRENPELMVMLPGGGVCYRGAEPTGKAGPIRKKIVCRMMDRTKVFPNLGHGTLAGERPQQFAQEVQAAHACSLRKA